MSSQCPFNKGSQLGWLNSNRENCGQEPKLNSIDQFVLRLANYVCKFYVDKSKSDVNLEAALLLA